MSLSGAPKKMAGMKSRKVWVIARAVMKVRIVGIDRDCESGIARRKVVIMLICRPGVRPVRVPASMPQRIAMIISIGMCWCCF